MTSLENSRSSFRPSAVLLLCMVALPIAGCSPDVGSADDVFVPYAPEQRFPIAVVDRPVKMTVPAGTGRLAPEEVNRLVRFAREADAGASSPIQIAYPKGSAKARKVAGQSAQLLAAQGIARGMIQTTNHAGSNDVVSLSFTRKAAVTKECGDWSRDMANDPKNMPPADFGCSMQNNVAAMVANPQDIQQPRNMSPAHATSRMPGMNTYQSGEWSQMTDQATDGFTFFPAR